MMYRSPADAGFDNSQIEAAQKECQKSGAAAILVIYDGAVLMHISDLAKDGELAAAGEELAVATRLFPDSKETAAAK